MVWFPVDDSFHSHPKQTAASLAAIGLWTVAGSWSGKHLTDGFVPDHQIPLLSRGQTELAKELVSAGLWKRTRGGYQFHQWAADGDGSARNPTRDEAMAKRSRMVSGGALGNHRRWHVDKGVVKDDCLFCQEKPDRPPDRPPDSGGESGGNPPSPIPSLRDGGSVGESSSGSRRAREDDDLIEKIDKRIIELIHETTGRTVDRGHAAAVRHQILDDRDVGNPLAYVLAAIRGEPDRYLPGEGHDPASRTLAEALAPAACDHGDPRGPAGCGLCRRGIPAPEDL